MGALTFKALRLLADGHFHSGAAIARRLARSRATLSEALKGAPLLGVEIFPVPGKGYRLADPIEFLDAHAIAERLAGRTGHVNLHVLDEVDSTSTHLAALAQAGAPSGTCVVAEWQKAGRGRRGRAWHSGLGASLTFSLLWRFERGPGQLAGLSLAVAVAMARALERAGVAGVGVKWPNDLVCDWKKLAGILVETSGEISGPTAAVIGVGVNYRLGEALEKRIDQPAIDVASAAAAIPSRNALLADLVGELVAVLEQFEREGFAAFRDEWRARHAYAGRRVSVLSGNEPPREAEIVDVAEDGALVVTAGASTERLTSAEISLRPIR
jgi:BirA family biotin operon repressor/biotin-[acetyl-CoA-carboxylase] ligase